MSFTILKLRKIAENLEVSNKIRIFAQKIYKRDYYGETIDNGY